MQRQRIYYYIILISFFSELFFSCKLYASDWKELSNGIYYQDLNKYGLTPWSHIHVFNIDLKQHNINLIFASDINNNLIKIESIAQKSKALLAINGGFFDKNNQPLGLRRKNYIDHNPLKNISWWSVFYVKNNIPYITHTLYYKSDPSIKLAIQAGPRLIINNHIPILKPGYSERTALGIRQDNTLIILITENMPMTLSDLGQLLKSPPISCIQAINLDGGSSTQFAANIGDFHLHNSGFAEITDAIIFN